MIILIDTIRHGKSEANEKHIFGTDPNLSDIGKGQAQIARQYYPAIFYDECFCATKLRTQQTAEILFQKPIKHENQLSVFDEIWFGNAEGKNDTRTGVPGYQYEYHQNFVAFMKECKGDDPFQRGIKFFQTIEEIAARLASDPKRYPHGYAAIVTSDTLMRCAVLTFLYKDQWTDITQLKRIENLDALRFSIDVQDGQVKIIRIDRIEQGHPVMSYTKTAKGENK